MNRKEAAELLPIIKAFSEGKTLQIRQNGREWVDIETASFTGFPSEYRIKPEYRPFANAEECWQEMLRHEPFGWVKSKQTQNKFACKIVGKCIVIGIENDAYTYDETFGNYTFTDGLPFGIKVEE